MQKVYDRYAYGDEKRRALENVAVLIDSIVSEPANVVVFASSR
jgi:hypothetical protein